MIVIVITEEVEVGPDPGLVPTQEEDLVLALEDVLAPDQDHALALVLETGQDLENALSQSLVLVLVPDLVQLRKRTEVAVALSPGREMIVHEAETVKEINPDLLHLTKTLTLHKMRDQKWSRIHRLLLLLLNMMNDGLANWFSGLSCCIHAIIVVLSC